MTDFARSPDWGQRLLGMAVVSFALIACGAILMIGVFLSPWFFIAMVPAGLVTAAVIIQAAEDWR